MTLTNGQRVRLVQIDTPEVYFGAECYGRQASALTKRLRELGAALELKSGRVAVIGAYAVPADSRS